MKLPAFVRDHRNWFRAHEVFPAPPPRKQDAPCCQAKALPDGRPVIGFCGPLCIRRPWVWTAHLRGES